MQEMVQPLAIEAPPEQVADSKTGDMKPIPYPGKMKITIAKDYFFGVAVEGFPVTEPAAIAANINAWADAHPSSLVVDVKIGHGFVLVFHTRSITDEELTEFNEINQEAGRLISERRRKEAEQRAEFAAKSKGAAASIEKKKADEFKHLKEMAAIGERHLKNCKGAKK